MAYTSPLRYTDREWREMQAGAYGFEELSDSDTGASALGLSDTIVSNGAFADPTTNLLTNGAFDQGIGDDLVSDGDMAPTLGSIISGGAFGSAADAAKFWSFSTGWSYDSGNDNAKAVSCSNVLYYNSTLAKSAITAGRRYRLVFTAATSGGSVTATVGGVEGTERSGSTTYTEDFLATSDGEFYFTGDGFTGSVDTVALYDLDAQPWYWDLDGTWTVSGGVATRTAGADGVDLKQEGILTPGKNYRVTYTITRSAGAITPYCGSTGAGTEQNSADTYTEDILCAGSGDLIFKANATFAGTVDDVSVYELDESEWTWDVSKAWTIDTSNEYAEADGTSGADDLVSTSEILTVGNMYEITFTTSNRSAGGVTVKAGTAAGTAREGNTSYTEYLTCAGDGYLRFSADADFDGRVDTVIVYDLTSEYKWELDTDWSRDTGKATHGGNTADDLVQPGILTVGEWYRVAFTVSGRGAGTVTPYLGTTAGSAVNSNTTSVQSGYCAGNTNLIFTADADFDGSIDDVAVYTQEGQYWKLKAWGGNATFSAICWEGDDLSSDTLLDGDEVIGSFSVIDVTSGKLLAYKGPTT